MKSKTKTVVILAIAVLLAGLAGFAAYQFQKSQEMQDRAAAETKLQALMEKKHWADEQTEQNRRWAEQVETQRQTAQEAETARPRYSPYRLAAAAKPRTWEHITVPDLNIQAVLNTIWSDGKLHYRVALLGQQSALNTFIAQYKEFRVNFADHSGSETFAFGISPDQFQLDAPTVNGGIPTFETSNNIECDLPRYEVSVQWNLTWIQ